MTLSRQIPIFHSSPVNSNATFRLFSALPTEVRLYIWKLALQQNRLIRIHLSNPYLEDHSTLVDRLKAMDWNSIRPDEDIGRYSVTIHGFQALNKFLHVCKESREESLRHYRVHLPCRFIKVDPDAMRSELLRAVVEDKLDSVAPKGNFYMNPEWDYMEVTCWPKTGPLLFPFLADLRSRYDPAGVGLLNLVVPDQDFFNSDLDDLRGMNLPQDMRQSTTAALWSLRNVCFNRIVNSGRLNLGCYSSHIDDTFFNRAFPINTRIPRFDLACPDPRPVAKDLKRQWMGTHQGWRKPYHSFTALLATFDIVASQTPTQYRWMLSFDSTYIRTEGIYNRHDAETWLQKHHAEWWLDRSLWPFRSDQSVFENEEYVMDVKPAFGFWLFPFEVVNAQDRVGYTMDMSNHVPDLAVSVMP